MRGHIMLAAWQQESYLAQSAGAAPQPGAEVSKTGACTSID